MENVRGAAICTYNYWLAWICKLVKLTVILISCPQCTTRWCCTKCAAGNRSRHKLHLHTLYPRWPPAICCCSNNMSHVSKPQMEHLSKLDTLPIFAIAWYYYAHTNNTATFRIPLYQHHSYPDHPHSYEYQFQLYTHCTATTTMELYQQRRYDYQHNYILNTHIFSL